MSQMQGPKKPARSALLAPPATESIQPVTLPAVSLYTNPSIEEIYKSIAAPASPQQPPEDVILANPSKIDDSSFFSLPV